MITAQKVHSKPNLMKTKNLIVAATIVGSAFIVQQASAAFTVFDNFNSYNSGVALDGQGGWTLGGSPTPVASSVDVQTGGSFGTANYAQVISSSAGLGDTYKNGIGILGSSTAATVYFQFSLGAVGASVTAPNIESINFDVDQNSTPVDAASASSAELNYDDNGNPDEFRVRNGGALFLAFYFWWHPYMRPLLMLLTKLGSC